MNPSVERRARRARRDRSSIGARPALVKRAARLAAALALLLASRAIAAPEESPLHPTLQALRALEASSDALLRETTRHPEAAALRTSAHRLERVADDLRFSFHPLRGGLTADELTRVEAAWGACRREGAEGTSRRVKRALALAEDAVLALRQAVREPGGEAWSPPRTGEQELAVALADATVLAELLEAELGGSAASGAAVALAHDLGTAVGDLARRARARRGADRSRQVRRLIELEAPLRGHLTRADAETLREWGELQEALWRLYEIHGLAEEASLGAQR